MVKQSVEDCDEGSIRQELEMSSGGYRKDA